MKNTTNALKEYFTACGFSSEQVENFAPKAVEVLKDISKGEYNTFQRTEEFSASEARELIDEVVLGFETDEVTTEALYKIEKDLEIYDWEWR